MSSFEERSAEPEDLWPVRRQLEALSGGALPEWGRLAASARVLSGSPGDELTVHTPEDPGMCFVTSGLLKATVATTAGRDRIISFPRTGEIVTGFGFIAAAIGTPVPDAHDPDEPFPGEGTIIAVAPTTLLRVDGRITLALADRHRRWSSLMIRLLMELVMLRTLRLSDHLALSPEERYAKVLREEAALVRQISQRDLALYLGVTPEALSRIAARARERSRVQPSGG